METWEAITTRRNVREFSPEPLAPEHLERILEAAWRSPSSQNSQPWDFVVVTERCSVCPTASSPGTSSTSATPPATKR